MFDRFGCKTFVLKKYIAKGTSFRFEVSPFGGKISPTTSSSTVPVGKISANAEVCD
jgi:hypothetical protein